MPHPLFDAKDVCYILKKVAKSCTMRCSCDSKMNQGFLKVPALIEGLLKVQVADGCATPCMRWVSPADELQGQAGSSS